MTYRTGTTEQFREVSNYLNDGIAISFKGRKVDSDGNLGPMSDWWIPITDNVRSVAVRETTTPPDD